MWLKLNCVLESADPTTFPAGVRSGIGSSVAWRQIAEQSPGVEMRCFQPPRKLPVGFIHHPKPSAAVRLLLSLAERSAGASTTKQQAALRSEEHPSELQSLMRNSYAVFSLKKNKKTANTHKN